MDSTYLASFGRLEDRHWWFRARREILLDQLGPFVPEECRLLDVGAGTGGFLSGFHAACPEAECRGVEPDEHAREYCRQQGLTVFEGGALPLPLESGCEDIVSALDVLEHIEDDAAAAREIARVLKPGGIALVTVPAYQWLWGPHDVINHHQRRYVRRQLEEVLREAGLTVLRSTYFNTVLFPAAVLQRLLARLTGKHGETESLPWGPVNAVLYRLFLLERSLLHRIRLPYGVSIMVIARKTGQ